MLCFVGLLTIDLHSETTQSSEQPTTQATKVSESKTSTITEPEKPTEAPKLDTEEPAPLEEPDDSSERVGFGSSTSPLDKPPEPTKKELQAAESTENATKQTEAADKEAAEPIEEKVTPKPAPEELEEPSPLEEPDDSSERVGFGSSTSPLDKPPEPTKKELEAAESAENAAKQIEAEHKDTAEVSEQTADKVEPKPATKVSAPLEAPDDSSERVGFDSDTSPLDQTTEPTSKPKEEPSEPATTEQQAEEEAPSTPEAAPEQEKEAPPTADSSTEAAPAAMTDQPDESSERVGFEPGTSPLEEKEEPAPPPSAWRNTGIPFVDDTVYFVAPRAYYRYFDSGNDAEDSSEAFAIGGSLGLKSGKYKNFASVRLTAHTSQKVMSSSDDQHEDDSAGLLRGDKSYSEITEANLNLHSEIAEFRLGIQRIDLPYLNSHDTRMVPNTYRAYTIRSQATEKLGLEFSYVDGMRERTGSDYESLSEQAGAEDSDEGVYLVGARYIHSENANVGAVQLHNPNVINAFYLEANALIPYFELVKFDLGLQFTDQRSVGNELLGHYTTQQYGFKLRARYENWVSTLVFTHTGSDNGIATPWGGSPSYNSMMISDFDRAGEKAVGGSMSYRFSGNATEGFVSSVRWTYGNTPDSGQHASSDQYEVNWNLDFYPKEVPNLWFRLRFARNYQVDSDYDDAKDIRFIVNYVKTF